VPAIKCPRCGRRLAVTPEECVTGIILECANCFTRVRVCGSAAPDRPAASPEPVAESEETGQNAVVKGTRSGGPRAKKAAGCIAPEAQGREHRFPKAFSRQ
jgi:hypothetical protein